MIDATDRKQAEDERHAHLWFLESMDRVNRALQETVDLDQMVTDVLDVVLAIFECDRARLLYPCDPEVASDRLAMERTRPEYPGTFALGADIPTGPEVARVYRLVLASSGPVRLDPASEHAMAPELAERLGVKSMMVMAIYPKLDKPYAFVLHQCSHPRVWTPQEERLFQEIGWRLAGALDMLLMLRSLRESERKLEEAQRISHVGHWERDLAVDEYVWSEETYRIFGLWPPEGTYSFDEHQERVHPADRHLRAAALAAALQSGRYDVEYRAIRPSGEVRFVHAQGDVVRDESGRPRRLFGTVQDVTELRRAEEEIRTSEARFRTFVDHATDAFFLHDDGGAVLDVNRQACESLGYTRAELIGMTPSDFDVDVDPTFLDRIDERLRAGEIVAFDTRHRRKDGTVFPAEVRIRPFSQAGRGFRVALVRDITERKRAEQRLVAQHTVTQILAEAATLEAATPRFLRAVCECLEWDLGALWSIDGDAGVLRCVEMWHRESVDVVQFEAISRQTTFRTGVGLPGRVWSSREPVYIPDIVHDPHFPRAPIAARAGLHAAFAFPILLGGDVSGVIEFFSHEIRPPDQDLLNMMATIGSQIGLFIERKRAEEALRKVQAELAHVTRVATLGELTGSIAHEINQPLGAVVNNASACLRWLTAQNLEEARQSAARVIADGHRASEIIGRIRALAKKTPPRKDWLDINETLREVLTLAQSEAQGHRVSLQTRWARALPPVWGDRIQVQQVVLNLLVNAVEALNGVREGPRDLCVSTDSGAAGDVVITVRDSGPGLDPQSLDRLFEAFYTTKPDGLGMGLAISRSIVESHGGRLWATANTPRGAVFQFTLPPRRERAS